MAAAYDSSGVGAVRPDVPQSLPGTLFRVTVDNALTFDFPTLSGAAAFIEGYGSGDLFEVDSETGLQTPVDVVPANLSQIPPGPAAGDPVASREAEAVAPLSCAAETEVTHRTVWIIRKGRAIVFTDPSQHVCKLLQQRLGFGEVVAVKPGPGETVTVTPVWQKRLRRLLASKEAGPGDPSPELIAERCQKIQAGWTPKERRRRRFDYVNRDQQREIDRSNRFTVPVCRLMVKGGAR